MKYLVQLRPPQFVFLVALSLAAIPGLAVQSEADNITITFIDSTEFISSSTTDTSGRVQVVECPDLAAPFESCIVHVAQPSAGATISSANFLLVLLGFAAMCAARRVRPFVRPVQA